MEKDRADLSLLTKKRCVINWAVGDPRKKLRLFLILTISGSKNAIRLCCSPFFFFSLLATEIDWIFPFCHFHQLCSLRIEARSFFSGYLCRRESKIYLSPFHRRFRLIQREIAGGLISQFSYFHSTTLWRKS